MRVCWVRVVGIGSLAVSIAGITHAQETTLHVPATACAYSQDVVVGDIAVKEGEATLTRAVVSILDYSGLQPNFVVRSSNVDDAMAILSGTTR